MTVEIITNYANIILEGTEREEPTKNSDRFQASQTTQPEASQPKLSAHGGNENSLT
ncbi:hypothetical protein [Nostoc sp.]|uniref:hypothetical protein n=1 Tax=Nostoc sp. TaxID=1180 RepID=UPI002FF926B5